MNRIAAVAFILVCFEAGLFLIWVPWTGFWDNNALLSYAPGLQSIALSNFTRGAVSGLGIIDCFLGLAELAALIRSFSIPRRQPE